MANGNPNWLERTQADVIKLVESRFTGWICVSIIGSFLYVCVAHALGYAAKPLAEHAKIAEMAFVVYVVKKVAEKPANGNGAKP